MAILEKNTVERDDLLTALYQTSSKKELLTQFDHSLSVTKGSSSQRYTHLLEQVLFFSHAIIFGHGVQTAHNYRQNFMSTAKKNKSLKLSSEEIEKAFSFLNRTEKKALIKEVNEATQTLQNSPLESNGKCIAKDEIRGLKAQLDNKSYELSRGQKAEDKEIFIKVALVALATGSRLKDIMEDLTVSTKKGVIYFNDGIKEIEGIILILDAKTVQGYLKAIRSHYKGKTGDIGTGIRKSVLRLSIPFSGNHTQRKIKNKKTGEIKIIEYKNVSTSLNHLNALYQECLTSSTPK